MPNYALAEWVYKQRYLHRLLRETIVKCLAPGFRQGHTFTMDFFGMKWVGKTDNYLDYQVLLRGAYEKFMLFFMRDVIVKSGDGKVVLDIGANVGNHALFLSRFASKVYAFEPFGPARNSLEQKIRLNSINNIVVLPLGLSDRKESIPYYPANSNLGTGSFQKGFFQQEKEKAVILEVDTGDAVVSSNNISGIDLIKIDVEGFEEQVLAGLCNTLAQYRPVVIFETLADTRKSNETSFQKMESLFPENYLFFEFARRDKKAGRYSITRITSVDSLKSNDIIAFPEEKFRKY